jgi:hypothetical protein
MKWPLYPYKLYEIKIEGIWIEVTQGSVVGVVVNEWMRDVGIWIEATSDSAKQKVGKMLG